jgi:hypothetical protein
MTADAAEHMAECPFDGVEPHAAADHVAATLAAIKAYNARSASVTSLDLDATEARAAAATEGPWQATEALDADPDAAIGVAAGWVDDEYTSMVVTTSGSASYDLGEPTDKPADAEFIAAAREDVPALVDALRRARGCAVALEQECASLTEQRDAALRLAQRRVEECAQLTEQRETVLALHQPGHVIGLPGVVCDECCSEWPCPTARALGVTE